MERVQPFLNRILRNTFLSGAEKAEWTEEMDAHLQNSIADLQKEGYSHEQAVDRALEKFGDPIDLRRSLTRELFGFSTRTLFWATVAIVILGLIVEGLLRTLGLLHTRSGEIWPLVVFTMFLLTISMIVTRKPLDRICLAFAPLLFVIGSLQTYAGFLVHGWGHRFEFLLFRNLFFPGAYDQGATFGFNLHLMWAGSIGLMLFSSLLFSICKNRRVALMPIVFSIFYDAFFTFMKSVYFVYNRLVVSSAVSTDGFFHPADSAPLQDICLKVVAVVLMALLFRLLDRRFVTTKDRALP